MRVLGGHVSRGTKQGVRIAAGIAISILGPGAYLTASALSSGPASGASAYQGTATADLVTADALDAPGTFDLANAQVAPANSAVDSGGGLTSGSTTGLSSTAHATNLNVNLLSGAIPLDNLLVQANQTAPPDNAKPATDTLLSLPANPLLDATVASASAHARFIPGQCVPAGTPISDSSSFVADASLLNGVIPGGSAKSSLLSVDNAQGATVSSHTTDQLVTVSGQSTDGLESSAETQLTGVTLLSGTPNALTINVVAPDEISASATGTPGGAKVTYQEPILDVVQGGKDLGSLDAANPSMSIGPLSGPGGLNLGIISLSIGSPTNVTQSSDGTHASGGISLLHVSVPAVALGSPIPLPAGVPTVLDLEVSPLTASATVPSGGVSCPSTSGGSNPLSELHKDLSSSVVSPGGSFNYIVAVPNRGTCTLTAVNVVDTVSGPSGSTISATSPTATSVSGLSATWNDIGPIAPNQTKDLLLTVTAPSSLANGALYSNDVTVSAVCNGSPVSNTASISGPTGVVAPTGSCNLAGSDKAASHLQVTPGETFDYYIHVLNAGATPCAGTTVTDTLGPNVTFVSCTGECTNSGGTLSWNVGSLGPDQSETLAVTVSSSSKSGPDPTGTTLPDQATVNATGIPSVTVQTPGPTVSGTSQLAPPSPATPPTATSPASGSTGPGGTPTSSSGGPGGTGTTSGLPATAASSGVAPATSAATSPTNVHTGLWFAGSTLWIALMVLMGGLLLAWPRIGSLLAPATRVARRRVR